ncbi:hypothetical protein AK830_g10140 [Neonectria ditissima]|uniref:F-box domain-containing protein n=1 Tax=Neonectria ditissima TaxID=78410 RepID=A0A0P7B7P0_9HYPO|nr:hypothetical protein AK830_g10140 [Neonectria ditissima]
MSRFCTSCDFDLLSLNVQKGRQPYGRYGKSPGQTIPLLSGEMEADEISSWGTAADQIPGTRDGEHPDQTAPIQIRKIARLLRWARKYQPSIKEKSDPPNQTRIQRSQRSQHTFGIQDSAESQHSFKLQHQSSMQEPTESQHSFAMQESTGSQADGMARNGTGSPLCDLPNELLVEIMACLPKESLWSLRQASPVFLKIFDTKPFRRFHGEPGVKDRYMPFLISSMTTAEQSEAAKLIRQDRPEQFEPGTRYCASCIEVRNRGECDPRMVSLRKSRFCDGCKERHAGIFFSAESIERHGHGVGELICIGRLGKTSLCSHDSHEPMTWETMERSIPLRGDSYPVACTDRAHEPQVKRSQELPLSAFPRLLATRHYNNKSIGVELGWDLPLLDLDSNNPPSTAAIRDTLANLVGDAFRNQKPCRHMADGERIRGFVRSGICECFKWPGKTRNPTDVCSCDRQIYLECADCGASYAWGLTNGRITLTYQYIWQVWEPTSPGWLSLLDGVPHRGSIFNEDNRHLLWCDSPGCATGMGARWEDMVKEETWLHQFRYSQGKGARSEKSNDCSVLLTRFYCSDKTYKMPPHTFGSASTDAAKSIIRAIECAAEHG